MGKIIRFFNYDAALVYYEGLINSMRQGSVGHDGTAAPSTFLAEFASKL